MQCRSALSLTVSGPTMTLPIKTLIKGLKIADYGVDAKCALLSDGKMSRTYSAASEPNVLRISYPAKSSRCIG